MIQKKHATYLYIILLFIFLSGCWSYRELEATAIATGIGFDYTPTGEVLYTVQLLKPSNTSAEEGGSSNEPTLVVESQGPTVFDAHRNASMKSSRKIQLAHNKILVFGTEAAQRGVKGVLDFFLRDAESRWMEDVFVADGKAADIINCTPSLESVPTDNIWKLVDNFGASGKVIPVSLADFWSALLSKTTSPVAPIVKLDEKQTPYLSGTAVFKDDKMIGNLTEEETRGLLLVKNKIKSGIITVEDISKNVSIAMEIVGSKTKLDSQITGDQITITIDVAITTVIGNNNGSIENLTIDDIRNLQDTNIISTINAVLNKATSYNADFFGFGDYLSKNHPKEWLELSEKWEEIFPKLKYVINVDSKIRNTALVKDKLRER